MKHVNVIECSSIFIDVWIATIRIAVSAKTY